MAEEQFGPYRLDEVLGRGGMGEVYRAYDVERHRVVALKRLPPALSIDEEFNARFRRESEVTARLREPHIIPIHDFGEIDGRLFIDMRLVDGTDLAQLAKRGPLVPERAVRIIAQAASALDAAHADGLVHRDVKPANVLVSEDDFVYLVDFGVARAMAGAAPLTQTGNTVGTMDYMAPERFHGQAGDARADIYSLTCVLYQALTGEKPYPVEGHPAMINSHLNVDPPKPSEHGAPATFDAVIAKGMAKNPDERYQRASELAAAARQALRGPSDVDASADERLVNDLTRAIDAGPESSLFTQRARAHGRLGDHDAALADFTRAIDLDPHDPMPLEGRAETYRQLGDYGKALADLATGTELQPELSWWQFRRAQILAEQGHDAASKHALDDAVQRGIAEVAADPDSPTAAVTLALMRASRLEFDEAGQLMGQALARLPRSAGVVRAARELRKLGRVVPGTAGGLSKLIDRIQPRRGS